MAENIYPQPWLHVPGEVVPQEGIYRFARKTWSTAGVDNYTAPPAQNPDLFEALTNVLPPQTGVLRRRWGTQGFAPTLDSGGIAGDGAPAIATPIIQADHLDEYENQADGIRTIIGLATDSSGSPSISNKVGFWNAAGTFVPIFTPAIGAVDPRGTNSRDYEYFTDGTQSDLKKWKSALHYALTSAANASAGNTVYTGTFISGVPNLLTLQPGDNLTITGFSNGANNGTFSVVSVGSGISSTVSTVTLNNPSGVAETPGTPAIATKSNVLTNTGIVAPTTPPVISAPTGGGFLTLTLSAAGTASGGNTTYTGVGLNVLNPGNLVNISGFVNSQNNGNFTVQSSTSTTVVVNNAAGVAETHAGLLQTQQVIYPTTFLNGWGANAHVGAYEHGINQNNSFFGTDPGTTNAYNNPSNAFDGDTSTFASGFDQHNHSYAGCVWAFPAQTATLTNLTLNVLSEVPLTGTDGKIVTLRSAGVWYSLDGGNTWAQVYNQNQRPKQWDTIALPSGQDLSKVQVMAFMDAHDDMYHKVYEINIQGSLVGTGPITLLKGRQYFFVYGNTTTGHFSDLSPVSVSTGPISGGAVPIQGLVDSPDLQVDTKVLLATADGGDQTTLYEVGQIPKGVTIFTDTLTEAFLVTQQVFLSVDNTGTEHGVTGNEPPPNGSFLIKHRGRMYMVVGTFLFFSKSLADLVTATGFIPGKYEEAWPPEFQLDISEGVETGKGLFSDGQILYIGTQRHIRRLRGDGPSNFIPPEIVFNEVGILNQDVWQAIFLEGTPAGTMWLTPDFRCIRSDFNTYQNVGTPIQTTLNSINPAAANSCWAAYVGEGSYNFYVLAIPTGSSTIPNTLCVYNIATSRWFVWTPADPISAAIFYLNQAGVPRFVVNTQDGSIYIFDPTQSMDRANGANKIGITSTLRTSFVDMNDATTRKLLNEIELATTQASMLVTLEGASTDAQFATPNAVVTNAPIVQNFLGDYKVFLGGLPTKDRFYRLTLADTSTSSSTPNDELLSYYSFEVIPFNRI